MDNKDFDTISEDTAQGLLDAFKGMNDALDGFEDTWQRNYEVLVDEIKLKCAGFYAYPNPECYVKKAKPDSYAYLIELERNLKEN